MMIALLLASTASAHVPGTSAAMQLCRPAIARKAEGEIQVISVSRSYASRRTRLVRGQVTVFVGMTAATPGSASTHHLIRATYDYSCSVRSGRVRTVILSQ